MPNSPAALIASFAYALMLSTPTASQTQTQAPVCDPKAPRNSACLEDARLQEALAEFFEPAEQSAARPAQQQPSDLQRQIEELFFDE